VNSKIVVNALPETVWDYTQDWRRRKQWDSTVEEVIKIEESPIKKINARFKGGAEFAIQYKQNDRPLSTSLAMTDSTSKWMIGGGGSWQYIRQGDCTEWTQHNTIVFKDHFLVRLFAPVLKSFLQRSANVSMKKAKKIIENQSAELS